MIVHLIDGTYELFRHFSPTAFVVILLLVLASGTRGCASRSCPQSQSSGWGSGSPVFELCL